MLRVSTQIAEISAEQPFEGNINIYFSEIFAIMLNPLKLIIGVFERLPRRETFLEMSH